MERKTKVLFKGLFIIVMIGLIGLTGIKTEAASKATCVTLKPSKTYHYNLDKKGKKESIKYTIKETLKGQTDYINNYQYTITLTVNGKKVLTKKTTAGEDYTPYRVMITDVNTKDDQMELLVLHSEGYGGDSPAWIDNIKNVYYYQYKNGKAVYKQNLVSLIKKKIQNIYSIHGVKNKSFFTISGKGSLYSKVCLKVSGFDFIHIKVNLELKNGKFKISSSNYNLYDKEYKAYYYDITPKIIAYKKPGSGKKVFTIKSGEYITTVGLYQNAAGKNYLKVKNSKGKVGYINPAKTRAVSIGTFHVGG